MTEQEKMQLIPAVQTIAEYEVDFYRQTYSEDYSSTAENAVKAFSKGVITLEECLKAVTHLDVQAAAAEIQARRNRQQ